jgi:hypothetical protein
MARKGGFIPLIWGVAEVAAMGQAALHAAFALRFRPDSPCIARAASVIW